MNDKNEPPPRSPWVTLVGILIGSFLVSIFVLKVIFDLLPE